MRILEHSPLQHLTTFGTAANARRLLLVDSMDDILNMPEPAGAGDRPLVVGGGSNILFTHDYDGTVIHLTDGRPMPSPDGDRLTVWAGNKLDDVVRHTLTHRLYGMENLTAIPGSVGGAVVQNAGAYGAEMADVVEWVEVVDLATRQSRRLAREECAFGYRTSRFKQESGRFLVVQVRLHLSPTYTPNLGYAALAELPHQTAMQMRDSIAQLRWQKLPRPEEYGSAGSFFKNPVVTERDYRRLLALLPDMPAAHPTAPQADGTPQYKLSAGWLIDHAGWKGRTMGRAGVWPRQALVLYNTGHCTGDEVMRLARAIQDDVMQRYGVGLEPEAIII